MLGTYLIVGVNTEETVVREKGPLAASIQASLDGIF